jgi:hypothetical protein
MSLIAVASCSIEKFCDQAVGGDFMTFPFVVSLSNHERI